MLVITAEALAGQSTVVGNCSNCGHEYRYGGTNREEIAAVLGADSYERLYRTNNGSLRHRLLHGSVVDENAAAEVSERVYHAIVVYLKTRHNLNGVDLDIVGAPRTFQSFEWFGAFLRCAGGPLPELFELERDWQRLGQLIERPAAC